MSERKDTTAGLLTRRRMLLLTGGTTFSAGLAAASWTKTGQDFFHQALYAAQPFFEGTPLEILTPRNNFTECAAFQNNCHYSKQGIKSNRVFGFGDSNMWGTHEWPPTEIPTSVLTFLEDMIKGTYGASWITRNFAIPGYSTDKVKNELVLGENNIQSVLSSDTGYDIFVNAGGNDFRTVMDNPARAALIQDLSQRPVSLDALKNAPRLGNIARDLYGVIESFGSRFHDLLLAIADTYGTNEETTGVPGKLRHIAVISAPDFSQTSRVDSTVIDGEVYNYRLQHPLVKTLTRYISIHLNDQMADAMNRLMAERPGISLAAINTFNFGAEHFELDQHWNDHGKRTIAEKYLQRIVVR